MSLTVDDAHFIDGKLTAGMISVPLNTSGCWLAYSPIFVYYPDIVADLDEYPIAARLFQCLTSTAVKSHADPMAATWTHMLAINRLMSGALEYGYQSFDSANNHPMHVPVAGEKYVVDANIAYVQRTDGSRIEHVHMNSLLEESVLVKIHDQESALFATHVFNSCHGYREILFVDANHVETRDLKQSATFSGINNHLAKVVTCMNAACLVRLTV